MARTAEATNADADWEDAGLGWPVGGHLAVAEGKEDF
jgi:hypothetical protein